MAKEGKKAVVPKLRFPDFQGGEQWAEKPLRAVCEINPSNDGLPETFIYIDLESVEGGVLKSRKRIKKTEAPSRAQRLLKNGDVVYQIVRPYQRNNLLVKFDDGETYVASTGYAQLRANQSQAFLYQVVHTDNFVERVIEKCTGSNYPAINSADLANVLLPAPPTAREQQKIADCLTSLDELSAAQGRKVEALKTYKRGLMQQLFPREGETLPRLRFPEFRDGPEWEEEKLGKHVDIWSGNSPSTFTLSSSDRYPYVKVEDLNNCTKYQTTAREFCDDARGVIPKHSLLFPKRGAAIELNKIRITESPIQIDTNLMAITPKDGLIVEFLFYCISNVGLAHIADTSTIPQINNKHIIPFVIRIPSTAEQQRIADALSALDAMITSEVAKLDFFKTHKMGLMQQLFPSLEEA